MTIAQTPRQDSEASSRTELLSRERLRPPAEVPGYTLERFLGRGTFGEVWVALDRTTGYRVAIKFFVSRGGMDWSLLAREVDKLRALKGDRYVVQLEDVGWNAEPPYFVMEYVEQGSLEERLQKGPLCLEEALTLFREVAIALSHAHNKGILHCDLKPANILLDQDGSPRLADFGQARLAEDHSPALGTWFYMAPEQAHLTAEPDARWDVYALGVVMYRMLTGQTPYQTEEVEADLKKVGTLEERLARYRKALSKAPPAAAHRRVPGMDRALADIVDRCLARDPARRYASVQAVRAALDARALSQAWRPLVVLGMLGPLLLLLVMALAAWGLISTTTAQTSAEITRRAQLGNRLIAQLASDQVEAKIHERWDILTREAARADLLPLLEKARGQPSDSPERLALQHWLDRARDHYAFRHIDSSWFLDNREGQLLAVSPVGNSLKSLDRYFWHRDYFNGLGYDMVAVMDRPCPPSVKPIAQPHQSVVFKSTAVGNPLMVVFSVPVLSRPSPTGVRETVGVLAMGVRLGEFTELWPADEVTDRTPKVVTLIQSQPDSTAPDARPDRIPNEGLVLEHVRLQEMRKNGEEVSEFYVSEEFTDQFRRLREARRPLEGKRASTEADNLAFLENYHDPLGERDQEYGTTWLTAAEPVQFQMREVVPGREAERLAALAASAAAQAGSLPDLWQVGWTAAATLEPVRTVLVDPGWVVVVQERAAIVTGPVERMQRRLFWLVVLAMAVVVGVVVVLWGMVIVGFNQASRSRLSRFLRRKAGLSTGAAPKTVTSAVGPRSTTGSRPVRPTPGPSTVFEERRPEPGPSPPGPATPPGA